MAFSNTFISLDDVDITSLSAGKFLRVRPSGNVEIGQFDIDVNTLSDVNTSGAYTPSAGQVLMWNNAGEWRPASADVYSMGNGLNKSGLTLNVTAGVGGGLVANSNGVYIEDISNIAGTYGNSSYVPTFTVNSKGQITGVTPVATTVEEAQSLNASYVGNVVGTSGQITVTGGTGINSNATLNLVATGVTSGVYGNTTHIPQITVDTYGRIQNVDLVEATGNVSGSGGNVTLAYKNIAVSGQTTLSADEAEDTLTFVGGTGFDWTTTASEDKITINANATALAGLLSLSGLSDVDDSGITNGQVLIWNSSTNKYEAGAMSGGSGGNSNVSLTDFSVVTNSPSGNGALSYDNAGVFTFTPANVSGGGTTQSLSWNAGTSTLTISSGNSVDLSALEQTLTLSGNTITISGSNSNVDLTSALGNVAGNYGDSNVASYLSANGYSNVDVDAQDLSITGNVISLTKQSGNVDLTDLVYANSKVQAYIDTLGFATTISVTTANAEMQAYVDALETRIIGGANVNLDSLAEVANALANSNTQLSTVAFTGSYTDLQNLPASMALTGNTYLTYDGANIDLSGVVGQTGAQGPQGNTGVGITSVSLNTNNLEITYSNASTQDVGNVRGPVGPTGPTGPQGDGNAGISSASIDVSGNLILTLNDSTTVDAGNVKGDTGATGPTGVGITSTSLVGGNLVLNYSNTSTQDVGNIQGPQGDAGTNGVDVSSATVDGSGNLIITLSDASTIDAGNVRGADGAVDQTISLVGNVLTISGSNSNVDFTTALAVNTDAQTLSLGGNVITISGSGSTVDLTSLLGAYVNTDSQTLTLSGNTLSISGGNSVDLSSFAGGGGLADLSSNVLADLSDVSSATPSDGQALVWDNGNSTWKPGTVSGGGSGIALTDLSGGTGIDYSNVSGTIALANTAVTPGTYGSATKSARITVDQQGRITSVTESTISGGGGDSGGVIEQFRLNYSSSGQLSGTANVSSGISSVTINSATGGEVTVSFNSGNYNYPPGAIMFYGYDYTNNKYNMIPFDTSVTYHEIPAGGSSGSPTLFDGASTVEVKLRLRESETGASRGGFGTTTHAFIRFVMYD